MKKIVVILIGLAILLVILFSMLFFVKRPPLLKLPQPAGAEVVRLKKGGYQLLVNGKPYLVKGVCYVPIPPGKGYDFNFWGDSAQPWKVDGRLMKEMGVNTVRFYQAGENPSEVKKVISDLYNLYGIRTALGHYLGYWDWPIANYADPGVREKIKNEVLNMVNTYKDEPGLLFWVLGNENNYSFDLETRTWGSEELDRIEDVIQRRLAKARIYYRFINELSRAIKDIDPSHPVVMGNGELVSIEVAREVAPEIDILGGIAFRGKGFGSFWRQVKNNLGKPCLILEFGCDSFNALRDEEDQDLQALYLVYQWKDIVKNSAEGDGVGNCLGGFVFEWMDEWWKHSEAFPEGWFIHDTKGSWSNKSYYDGAVENNMNEEWWGIVALGQEKKDGVNERLPRKAYYVLKELWTK
jgi:beta-galactosidase